MRDLSNGDGQRAYLTREGLYWLRMHRVQAFTRTRWPLITIVARWTLGSQRVLVRRLEWLTLWPLPPTLPHI